MKRRRVDNQIERRLLTAMITSTEFMSQASHVLNLDLIETSHFRTVVSWCLDYFNEYHKAPGRDIETVYHTWAEDQGDTPDSEAVHNLLEDLSSSWDEGKDPLNVPYLLDQLRWFIDRRSLNKLQEHVDWAVSSGRPEDAWEAIASTHPSEITSHTGEDPLKDEHVWERAFSQSAEPLFEFPGDAGRFLNRALTRDSLIGVQGPEKRGKTFWCIEFVMRALAERRKVAFFQVGDLSEGQLMMRLGMYLVGRPAYQHQCGAVTIPTRVIPPRESEDEVDVEFKSVDFSHPISMGQCLKAVQKFRRGRGMGTKSYLKTSIHPNSSINVRGIQGILARWEITEEFIPDVIVIDYADILAPEDPRAQTRDQVNETWKALRRMSQERHCLVIVPTQANAASYEVETQTMRNFSEDKRKLAHVTGMLGLNQTEKDKANSVMRLNWILLRESPFRPGHCLYVGQCLPLGRALYCSAL